MKGRILLCIFTCLTLANSVLAQTAGTLSISVSTAQTATATYAPKNIVAIWIEDSSGKFIKTLLAYANTRKAYLTKWGTSTTAIGSAYNIIDAISGATQSSHGTRSCSWNSTDYTGKVVTDGDYKVWMELTDQHSSSNYASFSFTKGPNNQKLTPADVLPSFKTISINWTVLTTTVKPSPTQSNTVVITPNPGSGLFKVLAANVKQVVVYSISGATILSGSAPVFDLTGKPDGVYFVKVDTGSDIFVKKIIKN